MFDYHFLKDIFALLSEAQFAKSPFNYHSFLANWTLDNWLHFLGVDGTENKLRCKNVTDATQILVSGAKNFTGEAKGFDAKTSLTAKYAK